MGVGVEPTVYGYNSHFQRFLDTIFTFIIGANRWLSGTILSYKETIKKKNLFRSAHMEKSKARLRWSPGQGQSHYPVLVSLPRKVSQKVSLIYDWPKG